MRFDRLSSVLLPLAVLILFTACPRNGTDERPPPSPEFTLTVWHAWEEAALPALETVISDYEEETGGQVELLSFEDESSLFEELNATENPPDVFFGSHLRVDDLQNRGIVDAYCRPPQCEECRKANPPRWCRYALGQFEGMLIDRFQLGTALCTPEMCPACYSENPPRWCLLAVDAGPALEGVEPLDAEIDVPRGLYSIIIDGDLFPLGIPIWWEFGATTANRAWFEEREMEIPQDAESVQKVIDEHPEAIRVDDTELFGDPIPFPADLGAMEGDPSPQPSQAALLFGSSRRLPEYRKALPDSEVLITETGFLPAVLVHGAFLRQGTELRNEGLSFLYELTYPTFQRELFDAVGALPANNSALRQVEQDLPEGAVAAGTSSIPLGAGRVEGQPQAQ